MTDSHLERSLIFMIKACGLPPPIPQYPFAASMGRKWRSDLAWRDHKLLVEVHGGSWVGGRHVTGAGFKRDLEKHNAATLLGYRTLYFTGDHIESGEAVQVIRQALEVTDAPATV